jgi:hypothetical protein
MFADASRDEQNEHPRRTRAATGSLTPPSQTGLALATTVIGTRWGSGSCEYRGVRRIVSFAGNRAARCLLPTGLSEYTTSYRAFTPRALAAVLEKEPADDGYAFFMEVVAVLHQAGLRLGEVPITFLDRVRGKSKIRGTRFSSVSRRCCGCIARGFPFPADRGWSAWAPMNECTPIRRERLP